jgi:flagellar basal body rod protein FlgG
MRYWERRQEIVANNLANVSTTGFKAERAFGTLLDGTRGGPSGAAPQADAATDWRVGTMRDTGAPLDLALEGEGFFVVGTPQGERLTRGGSLALDARGQLVDRNGNALLGARGPIVVSPELAAKGSLTVDRAGTVRVGDQALDVLRLEGRAPGEALAHAGEGLFVPGATRTALAPEARTVRQGAVEESNVNPLSSMVDMIAVQRAYAAAQKTLLVIDDVRDTAANQLGKA